MSEGSAAQRKAGTVGPHPQHIEQVAALRALSEESIPVNSESSSERLIARAVNTGGIFTGPIEVGDVPDSLDPAVKLEQVAAKRAQELVDRISDEAMSALRELREQIDGLMRDISRRRDVRARQIQDDARFAGQAIQVKVIVEDTVVKLRADLEAARVEMEDQASRRSREQ